jgi:type II secretory ATPase GspE/PulE/Tfp pilus assembly ATPase PilB-like protein
VVLRILPEGEPLPLAEMHLHPANLTALRALIRRPHGLVLCVGPTGSGKTTTLHSALAEINHADLKICTAEDPVEITQAGLRQLQVHPRIGLTFAAALRSFLRADPDVIMIGEMRDQETAQVAVEASLTGHLVLSTLHTNTAPETITRLVEIGIEPFTFADSLQGVLAQRLTGALCPDCREPTLTGGEEQVQLDEILSSLGLAPSTQPPLRARGCDRCQGKGYRGRIALHELLVVDDTLRTAIGHRAPIDELRRLARAGGMRTLLEDGVEKIRAGLTDLAQVLAVCGR